MFVTYACSKGKGNLCCQKKKSRKKENKLHRKERTEASLQITAFSYMELYITVYWDIILYQHTEAHRSTHVASMPK